MSELKKLVCKCKRKGIYVSLTDLERATERANLSDYKEDLKSFDNAIQNLKYADVNNIAEDDLQREIDTCEEYRNRIQECIVHLNMQTQGNNNHAHNGSLETARSLLNSRLLCYLSRGKRTRI